MEAESRLPCSGIARLNTNHLRRVLTHTLLVSFSLSLFGCGNTQDQDPPLAEIRSPSSGSAITGTVAVQIQARDESGIEKVVLYARGKSSNGQGKELGSSTLGNDGLYLISFAAGSLPNGAELELIAQATDRSGSSATSAPVEVRTNNAGAPQLGYLASFTLPPKPSGTAPLGSGGGLIPTAPNLAGVLPPLGVNLQRLTAQNITPQSTLERTTALEWGWPPVPGADGFGVYLSKDRAGPYQQQAPGRGVAATPIGGQRFSKTVEAKPGQPYFGSITVLTAGASQEGIFSNSDEAVFLPPQDAQSPADGQVLTDGRPTLSWPKNNSAVGYLYYVLDKNPWDASARILWSNFPQSTDQLSAIYPSERTPLPSGTYYWWVAAVNFSNQGQADAFSFSDPRRFTVP